MTAAPVPIDRALADPKLLGARFADPTTWRTWFSVLQAAYGRPLLSKAERKAFDLVAGGRRPPRRKVRELICIVSRRGGKGSVAGAVCSYEAVLVHHDLAPGERGVVACVSATKEQAAIVREYAGGFFQASPILKRELVESTADELRLRNGTVISTLAADFRSLRGRTLLCAILDEAAFLQDDIECAPALLPGLATTGGMLLILSSPYSRSGLVFERHRDYFGHDDDDVLVVCGPSEAFNPTLDPKMLAAVRAADPEGARSEWDGAFRSDTGMLFDDAMIEAAIDRARPLELPPRPGIRYHAFCDAAGGAAGDAYAVGIGHKAGDDLIIDVVRGAIGRFDPTKVTADFAQLLRQYEITSIAGDAFAAGWVSGAWREQGISYVQSERKRGEIYLDCVPLFARGIVRLPDHPRLLRELRTLERHIGRNGKETVNHPRAGSDDFANVAAGVLHAVNVAPSALWQRELLVGDGVVVPKWSDYLFTVVIASEEGIGATFFSFQSVIVPPLVLLDFEELPIAPASFHAIIERLWKNIQTIPTRLGATVFTHSVLADEFGRVGYGKAIEIIDGIAADEMLAVAGAKHIGAGRVKLAPEARARARTVPIGFLDGTTADDANPLRTAFLVGVAVALDVGRSLGRRAA
jgi:hypothetical protein